MPACSPRDSNARTSQQTSPWRGLQPGACEAPCGTLPKLTQRIRPTLLGGQPNPIVSRPHLVAACSARLCAWGWQGAPCYTAARGMSTKAITEDERGGAAGGDTMARVNYGRDYSGVDRAADPGHFVQHLSTITAMDFVRDYKQRSIALLDLREGSHVLEIGCGMGDAARAMARLVGPGGR